MRFLWSNQRQKSSRKTRCWAPFYMRTKKCKPLSKPLTSWLKKLASPVGIGLRQRSMKHCGRRSKRLQALISVRRTALQKKRHDTSESVRSKMPLLRHLPLKAVLPRTTLRTSSSRSRSASFGSASWPASHVSMVVMAARCVRLHAKSMFWITYTGHLCSLVARHRPLVP